MADKMSIDKTVMTKEDSEESMRSSPENEHATNVPANSTPQEPQQPKRKGGRKPVSQHQALEDSTPENLRQCQEEEGSWVWSGNIRAGRSE